MASAPTRALAPIAGVVLIAVASVAVWEYGESWSAERMDGGASTWFVVREWLLGVLTWIVVGRIALSCLPPGPTGSHRARELILTVAVSLLVGFPLFVLEQMAFFDYSSGSRFVPLLPWMVVLVLRVMTLPGAMVPRHSLRTEVPSATARTLWATSAVWSVALVVLAWRRADAVQGIALVLWLAAFVLVDHAWSVARRAPAGRALLFALATLGIGLLDSLWWGSGVEVFLSAGACLLVSWIRLADRRSCWLAALFFATCMGVHAGLALAGLATLLFASTRTQRADALRPVFYCSLIVGVPFATVGLGNPVPTLVGLALVPLLGRLSLSLPPTPLDRVTDAVWRTRVALYALFAVAGGLASFFDVAADAWIPLALLLVGLELIPEEQPDRALVEQVA